VTWYYKPLAAIFGLLDPIWGAFAAIPGWAIGIGPTDRWISTRRLQRGLIIVLGGIEGPSIYQRYMAWGLLRGRWRGAIQVARWNAGPPFFRVFPNLMSRAHHERQSDAVVAIIREYRARFAGRPVGILALSGGCWITVRALEKLASHEQVRSAVLLAPAISPVHDLTRAAARCERGLGVVRGPGDWFMLGLGTTLLGTSDRRHCAAAGLRGWDSPPQQVREVLWRPAWIRHWYQGNHTSAAAPQFIAEVVCPWFLEKSRSL